MDYRNRLDYAIWTINGSLTIQLELASSDLGAHDHRFRCAQSSLRVRLMGPKGKKVAEPLVHRVCIKNVPFLPISEKQGKWIGRLGPAGSGGIFKFFLPMRKTSYMSCSIRLDDIYSSLAQSLAPSFNSLPVPFPLPPTPLPLSLPHSLACSLNSV